MPRALLLLTGIGLLAGCSSSSALVEQGATLYQANCQSCHGGSEGGTIRDIPPRHNANGHTWHHPDCVITEIVFDGFEDPLAPEDKPKMPAFRGQLTTDEVATIEAYIKTWWTDSQRDFQRQVTQQSCQAGGADEHR